MLQMEGSDIFWLLLFLIMIQPMLRQRWMDAARQRWISALERSRGSRVVLLIHRQETVTFLGIPIFRYLEINDSGEVLRAIDATDSQLPLDLILHIPSGLVLQAEQIARALSRHQGKVTVFVPHFALSGATLIALAADEIVMGKHAVLGSIDPRVGGYPASSLLKVRMEKPVSEIEDQTLVLVDQAEKAIQQVQAVVAELLANKCPPERATEITSLLTQGILTCESSLHPEAAKKLGLSVRTDMPEEVTKLVSLFPQPLSKQQSAEQQQDRFHS